MTGKLFFHVSASYEESDETMKKYYASLSPEERLDAAQYLREQFYKVKGIKPAPMDKTAFRIVKRDEI
jgi:hypothetical protein